ncbi:MAG: Late embryosis abundant protein [Candidatus Acidoferrum typicum]|nr:Late embryosis abundant protein [Candidatus Acidoferrum typicum]
MDAQGRYSATDAGTEVKDKVSDLGRKAGEKLDQGRVRAADTVDSTAATLRDRADQLASTTSNAVHNVTDKLQSAADYIRDNDARAMMEDVGDFMRRHPAQSLAAAAVVGFLAGRALKNADWR